MTIIQGPETALEASTYDLTLETFAWWVKDGWTRKSETEQDQVRELAVMALGLTGEVDEVIAEIRKATGGVTERIKKEIRGDGPLDKGKLKLELGDVLHYLCRIATHYDIGVGDVMRANIEKIEARRGKRKWEVAPQDFSNKEIE